LKNLWVSLSGAVAQQQNVDTIANNVANANTPGFKKDQLVFKEYLTALERSQNHIDIPNKEFKPKDFYHSGGNENSYVKVDGSYTDFQQGQLSPTGNPLDLAVNGRAFLEVLTPQGLRFTRKGSLTLSKNNELVTSEGFRVLSSLPAGEAPANGQATQLQDPKSRIITIPNGSSISINLEGDIRVDRNDVGKISLVEFNDIHALKKEGTSLYINPYANNISSNSNSTIHQGFIEESNVNVVNEISDLIKANRHFESIQKAIKAYDNISGRAVNDISRF
jgi:flagellar basal-body rod protein FlgF